MIMRQIKNMVLRNDCAGLRVASPKIDMTNSCLNDRSGAHMTRFKGDIQITILEPPGIKASTCLANRDHLRMKCRVILGLSKIMGARDDFSIPHDDTADRRFSDPHGFSGLSQGGLHKFFDVDF